MRNQIISCILSAFFLKEYNYNEAKKKKMKKKSIILGLFWLLFILSYFFGLPNIFENIPENIRLQISFIIFLIFGGYHWFFMVYISRFVTKHIAYFVLLIPMSVILIWNLVYWNKPTYFGAMDGFASIMDFYMQILILPILPTFLFALQMVKISIQFKAFLLMIATITSAVLGVKNSVGKEGYLSDSTGQTFVVLIAILLTIAVYLFSVSTKNSLIKK